MILFLRTILWSVGEALLNAIIQVKLHGATSLSSLGQGGKVERNPNMPDTGKTSIGGSEFVFKLGDNGEYIFDKASHQGINSSILQSYRKQLAEMEKPVEASSARVGIIQ